MLSQHLRLPEKAVDSRSFHASYSGQQQQASADYRNTENESSHTRMSDCGKLSRRT